MFSLVSRRPDQVPVPRVHDLRAEVVPGRAAVRARLVLRPRAAPPPARARQEDALRVLEADVPGPVPGGERVCLQVSSAKHHTTPNVILPQHYTTSKLTQQQKPYNPRGHMTPNIILLQNTKHHTTHG